MWISEDSFMKLVPRSYLHVGSRDPTSGYQIFETHVFT